MRARRSVLFVRPDYHCSFFYRDALRKSGWKADIFVPPGYPVSLLYSDSDILSPPQIKSKNLWTGTLKPTSPPCIELLFS